MTIDEVTVLAKKYFDQPSNGWHYISFGAFFPSLWSEEYVGTIVGRRTKDQRAFMVKGKLSASVLMLEKPLLLGALTTCFSNMLATMLTYTSCECDAEYPCLAHGGEKVCRCNGCKGAA